MPCKRITISCKTTSKPCENLIGWKEMGEALGGVSLLTPWLVGLKY